LQSGYLWELSLGKDSYSDSALDRGTEPLNQVKAPQEGYVGLSLLTLLFLVNPMPLSPGDLAPDFTLNDGDGNAVTLSELRGQWIVLYFYPRDNTPGCTKEACGFRDQYQALQAQNAVILGISTDDQNAHQKFTKKHNLPFPLLCDPEGTVATTYESYGLKKFMGKEFMGVFRNTFLIDPEGRITKIYRKVKPEPHASEVLDDLKQLTGNEEIG
jgi:peroxiredoxin Q/BCP